MVKLVAASRCFLVAAFMPDISYRVSTVREEYYGTSDEKKHTDL